MESLGYYDTHSLSTKDMVNLLKTAKNNITKELQRLDSFEDRLRQYRLAAGFVFGCSFVIMLFHPTPLVAKLVIGFGFSISFSLAIFVVIEGLNFLNSKSKSPITRFPVYRFWLISAAIFLLGFLIFSTGEVYVLKMEGLDFLNFYREHLQSYRPFSLLFLVKMSPLYIILSINASRALQPNSPHQRKLPIIEQEPFQLNLGSDMEILDPQTITHISVQEHYSRFYIKTGKSRKEIEAHLSLTNALSSLPAGDFIRVHRSHAVNLRHVSGLRKIDHVPHIIIGEDEFVVPISRRQYSAVRKRVTGGYDGGT